MSLPLRVKVVRLNAVKVLKFAPSMYVIEAIRQIQEKLEEGGEDHGLFQPAIEGRRTARWLKEDRMLQYYELQPNDDLEYKKKHRPLKIKLQDETVKTMLIDDTDTVEEIVKVIGEKMSMTNADEFSLREEGKEDWLTQSKPLHEQGVPDDAVLLFRKKFFINDAQVSMDDPLALHLVYVESRDAILNGSHPCTQDEAVMFGALQCQIILGNWVKDRKVEYKEYLPFLYHKYIKKLEPMIQREHKKLSGTKDSTAKYRYVQLCRSLKTYGITFFSAKQQTRNAKKQRKVKLGITRDGLLLVDEETGDSIKDYKLAQLRRWAAAPTVLTLDFGDHEEDYMTLATDKAEEVSKLLGGYIDLLLKKRNDASLTMEQDDNLVATEEPIAPIRSLAISSITTGLVGGFNGFGAQQSMNHMTGMQAAKNSGAGGAQRALPVNVSTAQGYVTSLAGDWSNRGELIPRNTNLTSQQWKKQLASNTDNLMQGLAKLMQVLPPNVFDRGGMDSKASEIAQALQGLLSAARNAAVRKDGSEDQDLINGTKSVVDAIKNLLQAVNELSANPNDAMAMQKMIRAQKAVESAVAFLNSASRGQIVDESSQKLFIDAAKGVAQAAHDLLGISEIQSAKLTNGQAKKDLSAASDRLKQLADVLTMESMVLAPAIMAAPVKAQMQMTTSEMIKTGRVMKSLAQVQDENSPFAFALVNISEAIANLLTTADVAEAGTAGKEFTVPAGIIFDESARLMGAQGNPELINASTRLILPASMKLVAAAKAQAEEVDDQTRAELLAGSKAIAELTIKLKNVAALAAASPADPAVQQDMERAAQRLADAAMVFVGDSVEKAALHSLRSNAKMTAGATIGLVTASRSAAITCQDPNMQTLLRSGAAAALEATRRLLAAVQNVQRDPEDINAQEEFIRETQECQAQYKAIMNAKQAVPKITDSTNKAALKQAADNCTEALNKLTAANKALLASRGLAEVDEAADLIGAEEAALDGALYDVESGNLHGDAGSAEGALQLLQHAVKTFSAAADTLTNAAANDPGNFGPSAKEFADAVGHVGNGSKALSSTTQDKNFQRSVLNAAKDVSRDARGLLLSARSQTSSPDDPSLSQNVADANSRLQETLNKLLAAARGGAGGARDCEEAEQAIRNALGKLKVTKGNQKDFPAHSEELENAIKATQTATYTLASAAKSNPKALGPSAKTTASLVPPLIAAANAAAGSSPTQPISNELVHGTSEAVQAMAALVVASKDALGRSQESIVELDSAAFACSEALNHLLQVLNAASPGQKGADDALKTLAQITANIGNGTSRPAGDAHSDLAELKRATTRLAETTKSVIVAARTDPEKLGSLAKDAASALSTIAIAAEGLAASADQDGNSPLSSSTEDVRLAAEALSAACESKDPNAKQQIVKSAKDVTTGTQVLIAKMKELIAADPSLNPRFSPLAQAIATSTTNLVAKAKEAATTKTPQSLKALKDAKTDLLTNLGKLSGHSSVNKGSGKGVKLLLAVRDTSNNATGMITASKEVLKHPNGVEAQGELTNQARNVGISIKALLEAAKALGEADLDEFIEKVAAAIAELDSAAISATVGLLENTAPPGKTTQALEEEIVELTKELANGIRDLMTAQKESPNALVKAAKTMSDLVLNLASTSKMAAGTMSDSTKQQENLHLAKLVADAILELMRGCKSGDQNAIIAAAKNASGAISKLLSSLKGAVIASRDCDEASKDILAAGKKLTQPAPASNKSYAQSQKELQDIAKDLVNNISKVVATAKTNPQEVGSQSKKVAATMPNFVGTTVEATQSMTDNKAKADLLKSAGLVVAASTKIVQNAKQVAADPKNAKSQQDMSKTYKEVNDAIQSLIASIKAGATGEIKCEAAVDSINKSAAELDSAALYAATGQLQPENDELDIDDVQANLMQAVKALETTNSAANKAATGSPDELGNAAEEVSAKFEVIAKESKNAASLMTSLLSQQEILIGAKQVGVAEQGLLSAAGNVQREPKNAEAKKELAAALAKAQNVLKEFTTVASNAAAAGSSGIKELEANRKLVVGVSADFAKIPANGQAGATDVLKSAKGLADAISSIVAGISSPDEGVKVVTGANESSVHAKALVANAKGATRLTNPQNGKNLTDTTKRAVDATATFLEAAKQQRKNQTPDTQLATSEASDAVVSAIGDLVEASKVLPGSEEALKLFQQTDELEQLAERELMNCAAAIEDAARTLLDAKRRQIEARQNKDTPMPEEEIGEAILDAARAITTATGTLVSAATSAQKELVASGKSSQQQSVYKRDPAWAKGLISASQSVAGSVRELVSAANQVTQGKVEEETLVAAAKGVAGATARLVFASRTKADPFSPTQKKLTEAAKAVSNATQTLVDAAKPSKQEEEAANVVDYSNLSLTQARRDEMEAQARILKLQKDLESEQKKLGNIRKAEYKDANTNVSQDQAKARPIPGRPQPAAPAGRPQPATPAAAPVGRPQPAAPAPGRPQPTSPVAAPAAPFARPPVPTVTPTLRPGPAATTGAALPPPVTRPGPAASTAGAALPPPVKAAPGPGARPQPPAPGRPAAPPAAAPAAAAPSGGTYTLEQLKKRPAPAGVDVKSLESYLSDAEFTTVFKMTKAEFAKLPVFKKNSEKQKAGLF